jgi:hypothetical protein
MKYSHLEHDSFAAKRLGLICFFCYVFLLFFIIFFLFRSFCAILKFAKCSGLSFGMRCYVLCEEDSGQNKEHVCFGIGITNGSYEPGLYDHFTAGKPGRQVQ